jgi:tRNA threonylcarbamoyladenosine biosynthesis protein TsaE
MSIPLHGESATFAAGEELGRSLVPGDFIALYGDLGAGKTSFVRGLAAGFGITDRVTSPTFALVSTYQGRLSLCHMDLYRLNGPEDLEDMGWDELIETHDVCAVEWCERAGDKLPARRIEVRLRHHGDDARMCEVVSVL